MPTIYYILQIDYVFTRLLNSRDCKRSNDRSLSTHILEPDTVVIIELTV